MTSLRGPGRWYLLGVALVAAIWCGPVCAGRGLELNGLSAESLAMGGADIAVARDTAAVDINPAGLTQTRAGAWDAYLYPYDGFGIRHSDTLGNNSGLSAPTGIVLAGSYAQRLVSLPDVVVGIGLFAQGGTGLGFDSLKTSFGTSDKLSSSLGVFKLAAGFGWQMNAHFSVGASLGISYAQGREKFFPETSNAASSFFGIRFDRGKAVTPNFQLGVQYRPVPELTLAAVYTSKTPLPLTGGRLTVDFDALGLGHVNYRHARLDGLALPQEVDVGVAYQLHPSWLVSLELNWLDYSGALRSSTLHAYQPDNPSAPPNIDAASPLQWRDQYVLAVGTAYSVDDRTILRGGFNIENNPIPAGKLSPVLNLGQQREVMFGVGRRFAALWAFDFTFEYQLPVSQNYNNPALPLGAGAHEHYAVIAAMFALSRRW